MLAWMVTEEQERNPDQSQCHHGGKYYNKL